MSQVTVGVGYPIIRKTCLTWNHIYTYSQSTDYRLQTTLSQGWYEESNESLRLYRSCFNPYKLTLQKKRRAIQFGDSDRASSKQRGCFEKDQVETTRKKNLTFYQDFLRSDWWEYYSLLHNWDKAGNLQLFFYNSIKLWALSFMYITYESIYK